MVVNTPVSGPGGIKRSLSCTQDGGAGWETTLPVGAPSRPTLDLPFTHYALIYYDNKGKIRIKESASIEEQNRSVFTPEVREKFLELIGPEIGYQKPLLRAAPHAYGYGYDSAYFRHGKRRKASARDRALETSFSGHYVEPVSQIPSSAAANMIAQPIGETQKIREYYSTAFKAVQQQSCRTLCKAFIKAIEDKKQVHFPYNGGPTKEPEKTKPSWWPANVKHKEPDHLLKDERLRLLIHIICNPKFPAEKLHEIASDCKRQLRPPENMEDRMEILNEIFKVRKLEERYERGEVDASTRVYIRNRDGKAKDQEDTQSVVDKTEQNVDAEGFEEDPEDVFPSAPGENLPSFASSFSMSNDRNQSYPLNESLSFGEQPRPSRSYLPTSAEYADGYSQTMMRAAAPSLVSPHEQAGAFDYLSHTPFTTSAAGEHHRQLTVPMQHVSHYDAWDQPFRPNLYNQMEFGAGQVLTQNAMLSLNSSHAQDMGAPHGLPDLTRDRTSNMDFLGGRPPHSF
ncbi:uncharacterized protein BDV17DRAFT_147954 [Aspergillus undulatus]|uniref:uncharacterized protein n=1 Tax=Aspergillus undulatus TaxID=1810928 RepID=UPI003CCD8A24